MARKSALDPKTFEKLEAKRKEKEELTSIFDTKEDHSYCLMGISTICKRNKRVRHNKSYYATNKIDVFRDGVVPICKDCIKTFIYDKNGEVDLENFKSILKLMDIPFLQKEYDRALASGKDVFGTYKANVNYSPNCNYENSSHLAKSASFIEENNYVDMDVSLLRFEWGDHYPDEDLYWLEQRFKVWKVKVKFDSDDFTSENMVRMICLKELDIRKMRSQGLPVNKEEETLLKMLDGAKLTAKSNSDKKEEKISPLGVRIADIELKTPSEVFEDRKLFNDVDGIFDYFKRFILRPLINYVSGSRDMDSEFNVEEAEAYINSKDVD